MSLTAVVMISSTTRAVIITLDPSLFCSSTSTSSEEQFLPPTPCTILDLFVGLTINAPFYINALRIKVVDDPESKMVRIPKLFFPLLYANSNCVFAFLLSSTLIS